LMSPAVRHHIIAAIEQWLLSEDARRKWRSFVATMPAATIAKARRTLAGWKPRKPSETLKGYVRWYMAEREQRIDFLEVIQKSSPQLKTQCAKLISVIERGGEPMSDNELKKIFSDKKKLAQYLSTLSVAQLETYKHVVQESKAKVPAAVKKTMLKLLSKVQEEQFERERDWMEKVGPAALDAARMVKIQGQIKALEDIQARYAAKK